VFLRTNNSTMSIFVYLFLCLEFYSKIQIDWSGYFVYNSNRPTDRLLDSGFGLIDLFADCHTCIFIQIRYVQPKPRKYQDLYARGPPLWKTITSVLLRYISKQVSKQNWSTIFICCNLAAVSAQFINIIVKHKTTNIWDFISDFLMSR